MTNVYTPRLSRLNHWPGNIIIPREILLQAGLLRTVLNAIFRMRHPGIFIVNQWFTFTNKNRLHSDTSLKRSIYRNISQSTERSSLPEHSATYSRERPSNGSRVQRGIEFLPFCGHLARKPPDVLLEARCRDQIYAKRILLSVICHSAVVRHL